MTSSLTVCSFYVDRRADYPNAVNYIPLLQALHRSCRRLDLQHVVLTDNKTAPEIEAAGIGTFHHDLPQKLSQALTESQARWLEDWRLTEDTLFVGADCLIVRDFREHLQPADLSIILRPGHKRHCINNGFMYVPAGSVKKVAPLFRKIADDTGPTFNKCHDMEAIERALSPMPLEYGLQERAGVKVNFLPMHLWNGAPKTADDPASHSFVLHFRGKERKPIMLAWAAKNMPEAA